MLSKPQPVPGETFVDRFSTPVKQRGFSRSEFHSSKSTNLAESYEEFRSSYTGQSNYIKRLSESRQKGSYSPLHNSLYLPYRKKLTLLDRISHRNTRQRIINLQNDSVIRLRSGGFNCPRIVKPVSSLIPDQTMSLKRESVRRRTQEEEKSVQSRARGDLLLDKVTQNRAISTEPKRIYNPPYQKEMRPREKNEKRAVKIIVESKGMVKTISPKEILRDYKPRK
eukprot:TRINITY_DN2365_c0_g4_i1.p1 TRINITY_DN2365_c0_g4~~TRINITY_DN2365_c0_g4_i1.p1  ORF type:complete len:224 (-),score=29.48 TRINITY_DN2365_c0_g4_i1:60-731(-)